MSDHSRTVRMYTRTRRRCIKETFTTYSTAVGENTSHRPGSPRGRSACRKERGLRKNCECRALQTQTGNTSVCPGTRRLSGSRRKERGSTPYNARRNPQPRTGKHIRPLQKTSRRASETAHRRPDEVPRTVPLGLRRHLVLHGRPCSRNGARNGIEPRSPPNSTRMGANQYGEDREVLNRHP